MRDTLSKSVSLEISLWNRVHEYQITKKYGNMNAAMTDLLDRALKSVEPAPKAEGV